MNSWEGVPADIRRVIEQVCTAKEIDALKLRAAGAGRRRIAVALGISESSVRDRLSSAERKIRAALEARDDGA